MLDKLGLTRRMKTFMAKWGGIFLASIMVVIAFIFLGMYLYASSRVNSTLAWVTQNITLAAMGQTGTLENPPRAVYRFILQVNNPTADPAVVSISNIDIILDEFTLVSEPFGSWKKTVDSSGQGDLEGDFTITAETLNTLISRGTVKLGVTGEISASVKYGLVNKEAERPVKIDTTISLKVD